MNWHEWYANYEDRKPNKKETKKPSTENKMAYFMKDMCFNANCNDCNRTLCNYVFKKHNRIYDLSEEQIIEAFENADI